MLLGGLWHGASLKFIFWGAMHGGMLAIEKMILPFTQKHQGKLWKIGGLIFTFHFVTLCWIFFRADTFNTAIQVITQIATKFSPQVAIEVITAYRPVFLLFTIRILTSFYACNYYAESSIYCFKKLPSIVQALILVSVIWLIIQTKSANIQPFIYFQF